jgi:hypothetical protein
MDDAAGMEVVYGLDNFVEYLKDAAETLFLIILNKLKQIAVNRVLDQQIKSVIFNLIVQ